MSQQGTRPPPGNVRILQVCNTDFYLRKFLTPLVLALQSRGYSVECLTEGTSSVQHLVSQGIRVHDFQFPRRPSPVAFAGAVLRMSELLRQGGYHVVNSHNRNSSIVARIAAAHARVPINLYTAHGFYFQDHQSRPVHKMVEIFEGLLARLTTYTLSQSAEDVELMTARHWISPERIRYIGNGIDAARFAPAPRGGRPPSGILKISAMGRLVAGKGFEDILWAMAKSQHRSELRLTFIGGNIDQDISPSAAHFSQLMTDLGLESQVTVTGMIDHVEDHLNQADVFIHPSYAEGMPRSLLEAMSVGLPCIATRIRGAREIIEPGENGLLYTPHDSDELATRIDHLFANPPLREALGQGARATVLARYQEHDYIGRQVDAIEDLLREKGMM